MKFFIISLFFSFNAMASGACDEALSNSHFQTYKNRNHQIWDVITNRAGDTVLKTIAGANNVITLAGKKGDFSPFDFDAVLNAEKTLLSLGEGASDFIYRILQVHELQGRRKTAYAVDMIYKDTQAFEDDFILDPLMRDRVEVFMEKFPGNYIGSYLQDLDLKYSNGKRMEFDEIVSSNSLGYLLAKFSGKGQVHLEQTKAHDKALLIKVLSHLKKGGHLRIWPYLQRHYGNFSRHSYMKMLLNEMLEEKLISNHNFVSKSPEESVDVLDGEWALGPHHYVLIQK